MEVSFLLFQKVFVALLLGSLVGLEREHVRGHEKGGHFAGIRTFGLFSLLGAISQIFFTEIPLLIWILSAGIFLLIIAGYIISSLKENTLGATTELAAIGMYLVGMIAGRGEFLIATALTLIILIILHFRAPIHHLAHRISKEELTSTVKFLIIAFIILPLLPNKTFGPFEIFNPYLVWLMVVFISGISFASYLGIKFLGEKRGIGFMGFLAGFVSSTALALSFSQESKKHNIVSPFVFAILIASSAMFFRVLFELAVLNRAIFEKLLIPFGLMGIVGFLLAAFYWRKQEKNSNAEQKLSLHAKKLESPFTIKPALKFGAAFIFILFLTKIGLLFGGSKGVYGTAILSGILDVDAITVSLSNLAKTDLATETASIGVFIAGLTNTISKGVLFAIFGNWLASRSILVGFGIISLVGILSMVIVF